MFELITIKHHTRCSVTGKNLKPGDHAYYCHTTKNLVEASYYESSRKRNLVPASEYYSRQQKPTN